jgi:hypothetical protein
MAGRMGGETTTIKNLEVTEATDDGLIVKGVLPGVPGGLVIIRSTKGLPEKPVEEEVHVQQDTQPELESQPDSGVQSAAETPETDVQPEVETTEVETKPEPEVESPADEQADKAE